MVNKMQLKYYDNLEAFNNALNQKRIKYNIDTSKTKYSISFDYKKIDITVSKQDTEVRSFSTPFFPDNNYILTIPDNCNQTLKKTLIDICNQYSDNEISSIIKDMPLLNEFSQKFKDSLTNVAIIWRDH